MSKVVLLAGSPSAQSKSSALLERVSRSLKAHGVALELFTLEDFPAEDLINARWDSPAVKEFVQIVAASDGLVVSTPVYKAAYSGALKTVLDLLPERALENKAVLALASAGSAGHLLAVDYALQPVLTALKARHIVGAVFATDKDFTRNEDLSYQIAEPILARLEAAVSQLVAHLPNPEQARIPAGELAKSVQAARISI
ncbi:NADPH-dependent FMN reductase [Chitinibacter sp. FCG-7]|uniref:NADPH-dependent FMN reductase n=1 Tax=Chitinibacter mangrovi TaxID=3153927 RepID=A0AAU7FAC0_9NEIS